MKTDNSTVQTRKNEERFITSDPCKMQGYYLAKDLYKTWQEDFIDEDTDEVVTVDRREALRTVVVVLPDENRQLNLF